MMDSADDYLIVAVNRMNDALAERKTRRKLRRSSEEKFFKAGCEGFRQLCEDHDRLETLSANIDHPWIGRDEPTREFIKEFIKRDRAVMKAAGLSDRSQRKILKKRKMLEFILNDDRPAMNVDQLRDSFLEMRDDICNHAFREKRWLLQAEAAVETLSGATIITTNGLAAPIFPLSAVSGWYGGNYMSGGIKKYRKTKKPFE